jgi:hypothetical protein
MYVIDVIRLPCQRLTGDKQQRALVSVNGLQRVTLNKIQTLN